MPSSRSISSSLRPALVVWLLTAGTAATASPVGAIPSSPTNPFAVDLMPVDQRITYSYDRNGNRSADLETIVAQNSPGPTILAPPVGIGTSSPAYTLDVIGNGHLNGNSFPLNATPADLFSAPYGLASGQIVTATGGDGSNTSYGMRQFFWDNGNGQVQYGWHRKASGSWLTTPIMTFDLVNNGNVGIGTTSPGYPLQVAGTIYATGVAGALSDIRHKGKVAPLGDHALETIGKLRLVSFVWKDPKEDGMKGEQLGFIAQEVEKVLPSAVLTENNAEKTKGLKSNELITVLTKAVQELKAANDRQEQELQTLKTELAAVKANRWLPRSGCVVAEAWTPMFAP